MLGSLHLIGFYLFLCLFPLPFPFSQLPFFFPNSICEPPPVFPPLILPTQPLPPTRRDVIFGRVDLPFSLLSSPFSLLRVPLVARRRAKPHNYPRLENLPLAEQITFPTRPSCHNPPCISRLGDRLAAQNGDILRPCSHASGRDYSFRSLPDRSSAQSSAPTIREGTTVDTVGFRLRLG